MRRTLWPILAALACSNGPSSSGLLSTASPRTATIDGSVLMPATLIYSGRHEGDHPTWAYRESVIIEAADRVIRVEGEEQVTVPAGTQPALLVAIEPTDGDQRLAARYHVSPTTPHYALRMVYVVNPVSLGDEKRSTGTDELVKAY
jgi:hypothetical protein